MHRISRQFALYIKTVCFTSHVYRYFIVYMCKYWLYEQKGVRMSGLYSPKENGPSNFWFLEMKTIIQIKTRVTHYIHIPYRPLKTAQEIL